MTGRTIIAACFIAVVFVLNQLTGEPLEKTVKAILHEFRLLITGIKSLKSLNAFLAAVGVGGLAFFGQFSTKAASFETQLWFALALLVSLLASLWISSKEPP